MDTIIALSYVRERERDNRFTLLSYTERQAVLTSVNRLHSVRRASTQITLLSARLAKWTVPHNFFDNRQTIEQLARLSIEIQEGILKMPRTTKKSEYERTEWKGFLNYTLNEQELVEADSWKLTPAQMWEGVNKLLDEGYRLTLSYSKPLLAYTATLQAGDAQGKASGWALSGRDAKAESALKLVFYKHFVVLEEKWDDLLVSPKKATRG